MMNIVIRVNEETKKKMITYYDDKKRDNTPPYAIFQADEEDTVITLYESGKAMFQGISADVDAKMWQEINKQPTTYQPTKVKDYYYISAIGSDEVGTGDYFGPIVVTASYVNKKDIPHLEELSIQDSKQMTDDKILEIVPKIIKKIKYASIMLTNKEYNKRYGTTLNMNKIKAILHNKVILELMKKHQLKYDHIIIDEFAKEKKFFEYLKEVPLVVKEVTFLMKAENKNLSVACASIISRYIFLKEMDKLSQSLDIELPKGAGPQVDKIGKEIITKYGYEKLSTVAKLNFKNTERILKDN